jgi:hypothetical protein
MFYTDIFLNRLHSVVDVNCYVKCHVVRGPISFNPSGGKQTICMDLVVVEGPRSLSLRLLKGTFTRIVKKLHSNANNVRKITLRIIRLDGGGDESTRLFFFFLCVYILLAGGADADGG